MKAASLSGWFWLALLLSSGTLLGQTQQLDFGDAPDGPYPTTLSKNGARHVVGSGVRLGNRIDAEPDGKQSPDALGDDQNPADADDEDGILFTSPLTPGANATVNVTVVGGEGFLNAWADFNANGSWADAGEQIFSAVLLGSGVHSRTFAVPAGAKPGPVFARFRLSHQAQISFVGPAQEGEVEDYLVTVQGELLDFGDAPQTDNGGFPTTLSRNGARHQILKGFHLGKLIDGEADGQPNAGASGDDAAGGPDDEDGVSFPASLVPGLAAHVEITTSSGGRIDAWIDFNRNLSWSDPGERIFTSQAAVAGVNFLMFAVPAGAQPGSTFARFRLSQEGRLNFDGPGGVGEVEDVVANIERGGSCDQNCLGQDFWLTFPGNYAPDPANPVRPKLIIVGNAGTVATVTSPGLAVPFTVSIPASGSVEVTLPRAADLRDTNDVIETKGVHVTTTQPVSVHGLSKVEFSSDGFLALPTEVLGTHYYVLSWGNVLSGVPELNASQFAIVAPESGTTVTINPTVTTGLRTAGVSYTITLAAGETYQLRATNGPPGDMTGTHIISDKPIAVFAGHGCANINSSAEFFCDYLVEQMPPVNRWVTEFYARRLATRSEGDTFRVLASQNNTIVSFNGVATPPLAAGEFVEKVRPPSPLGTATQIIANRPVLVAQYANSSDFDAVVNSDPFMTLVPGVPLFSSQHRFSLPAAGFGSHHINVIAPSGAAPAVLLDGVPMGGFSAISGTAYSEATKTLSPGVHAVSAPQPVGLNIYGWNQYESYGWPACFFFGDTTPPVVQCPPPVTVTLGATFAANIPCKVPVPDFRPQVTSVDNCPRSPNLAGGSSVTQDPPPGTLVGPGEHTITVSVADARGNVGSCTTILKVLDLNPNPQSQPTIHCPSDIVVACNDSAGTVVNYTAFGLIGCDDIPLQCVPPPGSLFPVGKTTVTCTLVGQGPPLTCSFSVTVTCAKIGLSLSGNQLTISWVGGTVLQTATSLAGPWSNVSEGAGTFTVNTSESQQRFYRIQ